MTKIIHIVVANKARCRLFFSNHNGTLEELSAGVNPEAHARGRDIGTNFDVSRTGTLNSAVSVNEDEAEKFARAIAKYLELERNQNHLEKVYLIAPPSFLGELREQLPHTLKPLIAGEVAKDLVASKPEEIRTHLPDFL